MISGAGSGGADGGGRVITGAGGAGTVVDADVIVPVTVPRSSPVALSSVVEALLQATSSISPIISMNAIIYFSVSASPVGHSTYPSIRPALRCVTLIRHHRLGRPLGFSVASSGNLVASVAPACHR